MVELREEEEILTDYHLLIYYNPYFFRWRINELKAELNDIYNRSASKHEYTSDGIIVVGSSTEKLAMESAVTNDSIKNRTSEFTAHTDNLKIFMEHCSTKEKKQIKRYFLSQFYRDKLLDYPVIKRMKKELYYVEVAQREERQKYWKDERLRGVREKISNYKQPVQYTIKREKIVIR